MSKLDLPLSHTPSYVLLTLALLQKVEVSWIEAGENDEPVYGDIKGTEAVKAALEDGLPGKEVRQLIGIDELFLMLLDTLTTFAHAIRNWKLLSRHSRHI
jgi:hypothetical protein